MDLRALQALVDDLERTVRECCPLALVDSIPFCPHVPHPRQAEFLRLETLEALFGGAAGGGKSDALLMAASQLLDRRDYAALILRRTFTDLSKPGAIMDRARSWWSSSGAVWKDSDKTWTFPSGARVVFGYAENLADIERNYQGAELQFIGVDELGQWRESEYRYLLSRIRRSAESNAPLRMRASANPGGVGHVWIKPRFVDPGHPDRPFIPSLLTDNPSLDRAEYERALDLLDERTRQQLRYGSWVDDVRGLVYASWRPELMVDALPDGTPRYVLGIDLGASESEPTTAFVLTCWVPHDQRVYVVWSRDMAGGSPHTIAEAIAQIREATPVDRVVVDAGALGMGYLRDFQSRFGESVQAAEKRDKIGTRRLLNGEMERGRVAFIRGGTEKLIVEIGALRWDELGLDSERGKPDHLTDAWLYAWRACYAWAEEERPRVLSHEERMRLEEDAMERARIEHLSMQQEW